MPFCCISTSPLLKLFYTTNAPNDDVALFDCAKPTILLMHPLSLDITWLRAQFKDPRFNNHYNMIAFDQRNAGHTVSEYSARRDSYVDAVDVAFAHEILQLPPVHIFAAQMNSIWAAERFALLFPEKCLSLCLCGIPADVSEDWTHRAFSELIEVWCFPPDLETFEQAILEMSYFLFDHQVDSDLLDELAAWWCKFMSPRKRRAVIELTFGRTPPTAEEYRRLSHPTLVVTGERSIAHPPEHAVKVHEQIINSQFFIVKGAPEMFQILPQYTSIANRVYANFLSRLPPSPASTFSPSPTSQPHKVNLAALGRTALARLASLRNDPSIATRAEPDNPLTFSMWPAEVVRVNQAFLDQMAHGEDEAFLPVDASGHVLRKFSRRHDDQWTKAAFDRVQSNVEAVKGIHVLNHA